MIGDQDLGKERGVLDERGGDSDREIGRPGSAQAGAKERNGFSR